MSIIRHRRRHPGIDYWPGFVDALSTLVLAIVFLLSVFMVAQFLIMFLMVAFPQLVMVPAHWFY